MPTTQQELFKKHSLMAEDLMELNLNNVKLDNGNVKLHHMTKTFVERKKDQRKREKKEDGENSWETDEEEKKDDKVEVKPLTAENLDKVVPKQASEVLPNDRPSLVSS